MGHLAAVEQDRLHAGPAAGEQLGFAIGIEHQATTLDHIGILGGRTPKPAPRHPESGLAISRFADGLAAGCEDACCLDVRLAV